MLPATHERLIADAVNAAAPALADRIGDLLRGCRDEDTYRWPLAGWRTPALGFTHTCRPGSRFGLLLFPSARSRCAMWMRRAAAASSASRRGECLGHAAHLLVDAAVPARAAGVWHLSGDPFEAWVESHLDELLATAPSVEPADRTPASLVESLASAAVRYPADTRATPLAAFRLWRPRVALDESALRAQAVALVPLARGHLQALFRGAV